MPTAALARGTPPRYDPSVVLADWQPGRSIDLRGRKKVLGAAGASSRTGDADRQLGGLWRYLVHSHGFTAGDFLEATYRGRLGPHGWEPAPYQPADAEQPLAASVAQIQQHLRWYDARLPRPHELHLVGYSLGGVMLFRALVGLLREDAERWRQRVRSLSTLASPHFGCDLGLEGELLGALGLGLLLPGGPAARELCALGGDVQHRVRIERDAEVLRELGIRLLTLADEYDVVVTPEDAVIAPPHERARYVLASSRVRLGGSAGDALHGHGLLLDNPRAWRLVAETIGPQEPVPPPSAPESPGRQR